MADSKMAIKSLYLILFLLLEVILFSKTSTAEFRAGFSNANLPTPLVYVQPYYDGNDSIYLFGGSRWEQGFGEKGILRYSISSDTILLVAEMPTGGGYRGSVQAVGSDIYYFGAEERTFCCYPVHKYDTVENTATLFGVLPSDGLLHSSFKLANSSSIVYFLFWKIASPFRTDLASLDMSSFENNTLTEIPNFTPYSSVVAEDYAYLFGADYDNDGASTFIGLNMTSLETKILPISEFPWYSSAVSDGDYAYILGEPDAIVDRLHQFNLNTHKWTYPEVSNFPTKNDFRYLSAPTSIFVEKLERIYYFGGSIKHGVTNETIYLDDIWYIDVSPCVGKPDGTHPHPSDCSKFLECRKELSTEYDCRPPLLKNSIDSIL